MNLVVMYHFPIHGLQFNIQEKNVCQMKISAEQNAHYNEIKENNLALRIRSNKIQQNTTKDYAKIKLKR